MSPVTVNLVRCRTLAACPACMAALLKCAIKREGRTITFDRDDAAAWAAWQAYRQCDHPAGAPATRSAAAPPTIRAVVAAPQHNAHVLAWRLRVRQAICPTCPSFVNWTSPEQVGAYCDRVPNTRCSKGVRWLATGTCDEWDKPSVRS